MTKLNIRIDDETKAALYAMADDLQFIGQRGPAPSHLIAHMVETWQAAQVEFGELYQVAVNIAAGSTMDEEVLLLADKWLVNGRLPEDK